LQQHVPLKHAPLSLLEQDWAKIYTHDRIFECTCPCRHVMTIHVESLLRLAPLRHVIADSSVRKAFRTVDQRWFYDHVLPRSLYGFNPYTSTVFLPRFSAIESWWNGDREQSARPLNGDDHLIREALLALHEYIHVWTVHAINHLMPDLGFGTAAITEDTFEDFVYCHLLTEAAAVAAIDYWYLCSVDDINDYCDIGTAFQGGIASPLYRRRYVRECRRHDATFEPQRASFLSELCVFYCTGRHDIFASETAVLVPLLRRWIEQEVQTRDRQLTVTRGWLEALAPRPVRRRPFDAPVESDRPWMVRLRNDIAELLWNKIHNDDLTQMPALPEPGWSRPFLVDHRYLNVNAIPDRPDQPSLYYMWQLLLQRPFDGVAPQVREVLRGLVLDLEGYDLALRIIESHPSHPIAAGEPAALLFDV
jgi:hypothetical protein